MRAQLNPVEISLKELPVEGREFEYSSSSGELNSHIKDLVGSNPYLVKFRITPMGNAFDLKGTVKTAMDLPCSSCGNDFKFLVDIPLNEYLVRQKPMSKGDFQGKANHAHEWSEGSPDYILLEGDSFHAGEYVHEAIALAEPLQPRGNPEAGHICEKLDIQREWLTFGEEGAAKDPTRANPFQVLEKFKLKS